MLDSATFITKSLAGVVIVVGRDNSVDARSHYHSPGLKSVSNASLPTFDSIKYFSARVTLVSFASGLGGINDTVPENLAPHNRFFFGQGLA